MYRQSKGYILLYFSLHCLYIVTMKEKKDKSINMRVDGRAWDDFHRACDAINESRSKILRDLCVAATEYIKSNQLTEWYPPKLVPNTPPTITPAIYMGNGIAHARERIEPIPRAAEPRGPQPQGPTSPTRQTEYPRIKPKRRP